MFWNTNGRFYQYWLIHPFLHIGHRVIGSHPSHPRSGKYKTALLEDLDNAKGTLLLAKDAACEALATKTNVENCLTAAWMMGSAPGFSSSWWYDPNPAIQNHPKQFYRSHGSTWHVALQTSFPLRNWKLNATNSRRLQMLWKPSLERLIPKQRQREKPRRQKSSTKMVDD